MDGQRFDQFVRLMAAGGGSRRRLVRLWSGTALGAAVLAAHGAEEAAATRCETSSDCPRRSTCCDRNCVDISKNKKHCGGCRKRCRDKTCCGGKCRDVKRDRQNCGKCRKRCRRDEACERGRCTKTTASCAPPEPVRCPQGSVKACCRADGLGEWECCEQGTKKPCCPPGDPVCCPPGTGGLVDCCRPAGATCCPDAIAALGVSCCPPGTVCSANPPGCL